MEMQAESEGSLNNTKWTTIGEYHRDDQCFAKPETDSIYSFAFVFRLAEDVINSGTRLYLNGIKFEFTFYKVWPFATSASWTSRTSALARLPGWITAFPTSSVATPWSTSARRHANSWRRIAAKCTEINGCNAWSSQAHNGTDSTWFRMDRTNWTSYCPPPMRRDFSFN